MPWWPPSQLEAAEAAQFLAAILDAQQRAEAMDQDGSALPVGGPGEPIPEPVPATHGRGSGPPSGPGAPPGPARGPQLWFRGFEYQLPDPPAGMTWVAGDTMGEYVAVPAAGRARQLTQPGPGPEAGPAPPPFQVPVPHSARSLASTSSSSGVSSLVRSMIAPPHGSRRGFTGGAPELFEHPDFPGHSPLALFRAILGRTRVYHASIREQMSDFEDWLDNMNQFFASNVGD